MELPVKTLISMDLNYVLLLGQTVQTYARFEEIIVDIIGFYHKGFKYEHNPTVLGKELMKIYDELPNGKEQMAVDCVYKGFVRAIELRNALFHISPRTSGDELQDFLLRADVFGPNWQEKEQRQEVRSDSFDFATLKRCLEEMTENYYDASRLFEFKRGFYDSPLRGSFADHLRAQLDPDLL